MKNCFTLLMIVLSVTAFSQTVIPAETFPTNNFNSTGQGRPSDSNKVYTGNNSISINNLDRLQPGIYVLQMENNDEMTSVKFSIAR